MKKVKILTATEAANLIQDGDTITTMGFVGNSNPEALNKAVEERFLTTGSPKNITLIYSSSQGNRDGRGGERYAHKGLIKRFIAGHYNTAKRMAEMAANNEMEAYNISQGTILNMFRDLAAHRPGTITTVGFGTFLDPRNGGGKVNARTTEDLCKIVEIDGQEVMYYKSFPIHIALIRGTYADEYGNISFEKEVTTLEGTSVAQAVKNGGGKVIVQVERIVKGGTLDPRLVKIPGIYVHAVVVANDPKDHEQSYDQPFDPSLTGAIRVPVESAEPIPLSIKKAIGRRAAMELTENAVVNLGVGTPEYVAKVAGEESIGDKIILTVESGPIGGIPQGGPRFGASMNPDCLLDQPYQFDFYDGGGLDQTYLGLAQMDGSGNINVSRFGPRIAGCGGFINISQNAKMVVFCGTFTTGGLKAEIKDGKLNIVQEGKSKKFISQVEQITFSGAYAQKKGQKVLYITERAVFRLDKDGVRLIEVAPGIDIQTQILDLMDFMPLMDEKIPSMDPAIFQEALMGLDRRIS